jgi:hypothetical protein
MLVLPRASFVQLVIAALLAACSGDGRPDAISALAADPDRQRAPTTTSGPPPAALQQLADDLSRARANAATCLDEAFPDVTARQHYERARKAVDQWIDVIIAETGRRRFQKPEDVRDPRSPSRAAFRDVAIATRVALDDYYRDLNERNWPVATHGPPPGGRLALMDCVAAAPVSARNEMLPWDPEAYARAADAVIDLWFREPAHGHTPTSTLRSDRWKRA